MEHGCTSETPPSCRQCEDRWRRYLNAKNSHGLSHAIVTLSEKHVKAMVKVSKSLTLNPEHLINKKIMSFIKNLGNLSGESLQLKNVSNKIESAIQEIASCKSNASGCVFAKPLHVTGFDAVHSSAFQRIRREARHAQARYSTVGALAWQHCTYQSCMTCCKDSKKILALLLQSKCVQVSMIDFLARMSSDENEFDKTQEGWRLIIGEWPCRASPLLRFKLHVNNAALVQVESLYHSLPMNTDTTNTREKDILDGVKDYYNRHLRQLFLPDGGREPRMPTDRVNVEVVGFAHDNKSSDSDSSTILRLLCTGIRNASKDTNSTKMRFHNFSDRSSEISMYENIFEAIRGANDLRREIPTEQMAYNVVFDLAVGDQNMTRKERRSMIKQLQQCYGDCRRSQLNTQMYITSYKKESDPNAQDEFDFYGACDWKGVNFCQKDFTQIFTPNRCVYLSPDSSDVLTRTRSDEVYIIGGLVDRQVLPNVTLRRAKKLGVRTARLPMSEAGIDARVLNINTVNSILIKYTWARLRSTEKEEYGGGLCDFKSILQSCVPKRKQNPSSTKRELPSNIDELLRCKHDELQKYNLKGRLVEAMQSAKTIVRFSSNIAKVKSTNSKEQSHEKNGPRQLYEGHVYIGTDSTHYSALGKSKKIAEALASYKALMDVRNPSRKDHGK